MSDCPMTVGQRWRIEKNFGDCETLLIVHYDQHGTYWMGINVATGKAFKLPVRSMPTAQNPVFLSESSDLIFASNEGISAYNLSSQQERRLLPLDTDSLAIRGLWGHPKNLDALYYIQVKPKVPFSKMLSSGRGHWPSAQEEGALFAWNFGSEPRMVARFDSAPSFADIDWTREMLFAVLMNGQKIKLDLRTGIISPLEWMDQASYYALSPRGTFVKWKIESKGIEEISPDATTGTLVPFGRFPAFSSAGSKMAFTNWANELWLLERHERPEMIASFKKSASSVFDVPTWCPCNSHFAVNLIHSGDEVRRRHTLVISDVTAREIVCYGNIGAASSGGRVWVPKSICMNYSAHEYQE